MTTGSNLRRPPVGGALGATGTNIRAFADALGDLRATRGRYGL